MARPEKLNVDYFPHYISTGKKMKAMLKRFGNDGYAAWFIILEQLALEDHHYLDLRQDFQLVFLSDACNVEENHLITMIDFMVKMDVFNSQLWNHRILRSDKLIESVRDVWTRRNTSILSDNEILVKLNILEEPKKAVKQPKTEQKKKESPKVENTEIVFPFDSPQFMQSWYNWIEYKKENHKFKYKSNHSLQAALKRLAKDCEGYEEIAIDMIEMSIARGWQGIIKTEAHEREIQVRNSGGSNFGRKHNSSNQGTRGASGISDDYLANVLNDLSSD